MNVVKTQTWHYSLGELKEVADQVQHQFGMENVWLFRGTLGAGKTTFIQALGKGRGVVSAIQSPTFALVNEYEDSSKEPIYHFDCYRINRLEEALDMGMEEYLTSGYSVWMEWPDRVEALWPPSYILLTFQLIDQDHRQVQVDWIQNV
ncbi:MAG: tRNA (adenosine(37)-N6)-threonylcarbamoyltransferase complex ATPase subunit type 1 TsaE [Spirosomataceae bacterium]